MSRALDAGLKGTAELDCRVSQGLPGRGPTGARHTQPPPWVSGVRLNRCNRVSRSAVLLAPFSASIMRRKCQEKVKPSWGCRWRQAEATNYRVRISRPCLLFYSRAREILSLSPLDIERFGSAATFSFASPSVYIGPSSLYAFNFLHFPVD